MKLTLLGTGNAMVTECYNTCFVLQEEGNCFLVDGGGGNQIMKRLKEAEIDWTKIQDIFVTHKHVDHLMGILWLIRLIGQGINQGKVEKEVRIYGHDEVIALLRTLSGALLQKKVTKHLDDKILLTTVKDQQIMEIIGHKVQFFDIMSTKDKQYGFTMELEEGEKLTCCGDEPFNESERPYAKGSKWLLHEAFCLDAQADIFKPYEKHHSTAKDASMLASQLGVKNLVLYHTEDRNIKNRKALYTEEGKKYFQGNLFVPDDLDVIEL